MAENVTVAVRVRPQNDKEKQSDDECIWTIEATSRNTISLSGSSLCDLMEEGKYQASKCVKYSFGI